MSQLEGGQARECSLSQEKVRLFVLFRPLTDWVRPTYITNSKVVLIPKRPHRNIQNNV